MLKYLTILLSDNSPSYCHHTASIKDNPKTIDAESLENAIIWAMKQNLDIQFVYPLEGISDRLKNAVDSVSHIDIMSPESNGISDADVVIIEGIKQALSAEFKHEGSYVLRITMDEWYENVEALAKRFGKIDRLNIAFTDLPPFDDKTVERYGRSLALAADAVLDQWHNNHLMQLNLLTDRIFLRQMNNCNAGVESLCLAPDGKLYICPAFYHDGADPIGIPSGEVSIVNGQLYRLDHAPICSKCDAYHCRRCIWQNKKSTLEVNTPGREQCVRSHVERNASAVLLERARKLAPGFLEGYELDKTECLDPFELIIKKS